MSQSGRVRAVAGANVAVGATLLAFADDIDEWLRTGRGGRKHAVPPHWLIRVLGARSLVQGAATMAWPTRQAALLGAAADGTHAASMLPIVLASSRYRRAALTSAIVASATALAGVLAGRARR